MATDDQRRIANLLALPRRANAMPGRPRSLRDGHCGSCALDHDGACDAVCASSPVEAWAGVYCNDDNGYPVDTAPACPGWVNKNKEGE